MAGVIELHPRVWSDAATTDKYIKLYAIETYAKCRFLKMQTQECFLGRASDRPRTSFPFPVLASDNIGKYIGRKSTTREREESSFFRSQKKGEERERER
jgi:hypothetical protein